MSLSKATKRTMFYLVTDYLLAIQTNPIRTKALTSAVIASLGSISSQYASGRKGIDWNSVKAFGLFGLCLGGTIPHFFFTLLEHYFEDSPVLVKFAIERLLYAPIFQFLVLYSIARFEGKTHDDGFKQVESLYLTVLRNNWIFLSTFQLLNLWLVPPMLRVLVVNLIGFFWSIYLATVRRKQEEKKKGAERKSQ